ncbi:MAG: hypothetical protein M0R30_11200 [Methanoregula sp.]|uniref:hypothetical protein n=1 Tax=Methanoregula sp. TaxID=2052170 RepID=UPI0025D8B8C7|nr:hypothetical protein [Methanoregula sp.]MCK9632193.1 hypothetical protein [Methanoregula sp.]
MKDVLQEKKGLIIFCLIALIVLISAFAAYAATGPMGIEERFNAAAGITPGEAEEEEEDGGLAGFAVEGNMMLYMLVLAVLAALCIAAYRHYHL